MNKLSKWWGKLRGKKLCHYCPDTWLFGFYPGGNCMNCLKCHTIYVFGWKPRKRWIYSKLGDNSRGDRNDLRYVQIHFNRLIDHITKECVVNFDLKKQQTHIILDYPEWTHYRPTMTLPYLVDLTPENVKQKVKMLLLFS